MTHSPLPTAPQANNASWLQGLIIGICIGGAFIGGWLLARQEASTPSATPPPVPLTAVPEKAAEAPVPSAKEILPPPTPPPPPAAPASATPPVDSPAPPAPAEEKSLPSPAPEKKPEAAPAANAPENPPPPGPLPPEVAQLLIQARPNSQVLAEENGQQLYIGQTNAEGKLLVRRRVGPQGTAFSLILRHPDCEPARQNEVRMENGKLVTIEIPQEVAPGALTVFAEPASAEVWLDGKREGQGVLTLGKVPAGTHQLELRMPGAKTVTREVTVAPRQTTAVKIQLEPAADGTEESIPETGDILLLGPVYAMTLHPDTQVRIDGKTVSITDGLLSGIPVGPHRMVIEQRGENSPAQVLWQGTIEVRKGEATSVQEQQNAYSTPPPAPSQQQSQPPAREGEALLTLNFIRPNGNPVTPKQVAVFFADEPIAARPDGIWVLPVWKHGDLRVEVPGFETIVHKNMAYPLAGSYSQLSFLRRPEEKAPPPAAPAKEEPAKETPPPEPQQVPVSWETKVLAVAAQEGFLALGQPTTTLLQLEQTLTLEAEGIGSLSARITDLANQLVICGVTQNTEKLLLLKKGTPVKITVMVESPAKESPSPRQPAEEKTKSTSAEEKSSEQKP